MESLPKAQDEPVTLQSSRPPSYLTTRLEIGSPEVTTQINEEYREVLDNVDDLEWLSGVTNGSDMVVLPLGENGTAKIFRLGINETSADGVACKTSAYLGGGVCVPLPQCVLRVFRQDLDIYLKEYFCTRDSLAGVCCPDRVYGQKTVTTENSYDTTVVVD
ncbi:uncharacterized protein LOC110834827 [Zootermopsis nevadensis]|uniref:Clip domain-containing protein n=1 Tax=Zootermopsis nevadensis TaxID=136037 RepID=A0A067R4G9_ZOONE|nr:uncharacterized protein LOC110834827 [Zootermopsis nevadensis]KDR14117.1 hypothetical protein L798_11857 [Zootermopsis nevadensis]